MFGLPAEQQWQLEIFLLLIWPREICMRSIYPNMLPLQWNFLPESAIVSQFPTFWGIGNPTDIHGSWGTWLGTIRQEFSKVAKIKNSITGSWRHAYYGSEGGFAREKSFSQRGFWQSRQARGLPGKRATCWSVTVTVFTFVVTNVAHVTNYLGVTLVISFICERSHTDKHIHHTCIWNMRSTTVWVAG